jgi:hypothetical protein
MMPSNRLALLAMLALGYLGLLSTHVSKFATLFALLVEQCVALGILTFFVPLNIWNDDKLTQTLCPDPRGSSSLIQVRALRSQFFHRCNWRCHWNFDFDNCPLLCGDHCVHPDCNNHRRPDLYPPPSPPGIPCPIPPPIIHHVLSYQRPGLNPLTSLPFLQLSPQFPPASLPFLNQSDSIDQFPYGLLQSAITRSQRPCCPGGPSTLSTYTNIDRVDGAQLSFDKLVDGLEGYIEECQTNRQRRPRLEEYAKMLDPIVYNPFLERDIIFPAFVPPPWDEQRSNDIMLQGVGAEPRELVLKKNVPLYLLQANVHLFGHPDLQASEHIHFSQRLSHPVSIPLNYVREDIYVQELRETFLKNSSTFVDGFAYYDEPLASTYVKRPTTH